MPFDNALVDRARLLRKVSTGRKVDGRRIFEPQPGPWFDCRLGHQRHPQTESDGRTRVVVGEEFLYALEDWDGGPVRLLATDELEVETEDPFDESGFVTLVVKVDGKPEEMRRRSADWVGGITQVTSVGEPPERS